jgi:hypothetical protein
MDGAPTDAASRTVWMANLLAYRALSLFPSAPGRRGLKTAGWSGEGELFTWPIWKSPAAVDTVRSLILSTGLRAERPDRSVLSEMGVAALFRARRVKVGSGANFKLNFSPAQSV